MALLGTGGWRPDPNTDCPSRWSCLTEGSKRSCGRVVFGQYICYSVFFSVSGGPYNQVCGRIRAYQKELPSAYNLNGKTSVDDAYIYTSVVCLYCMAVLDIWIFAAGGRGLNYCPCDTSPYTLHISSFVGKASVSLGMCTLVSMIICRMGKTATQLAPAALSTILYTSLNYLEQPT